MKFNKLVLHLRLTLTEDSWLPSQM